MARLQGLVKWINFLSLLYNPEHHIPRFSSSLDMWTLILQVVINKACLKGLQLKIV